MNILLDTHIFIWAINEPQKLKAQEKKAILDSNSTIFISTISLWEISLKYAIGKLKFENLDIFQINDSIQSSGFKLISLSASDALDFYKLPRFNKDPFDRMLVWQAINNNLFFLSKDKKLQEYEKFGLKKLQF